MQETPDHARCLDCNYPLRSLPSPRCPECGRPFDPKNTTSMNLGRVPGPIARRLLRHTNWPFLLVAIACTIALLIISGPPRAVPPRLSDTLYFLNQRQWETRLRTTDDKSYVGVVLIWLGLLACYFLRVVLRLSAQRIYQVRRDPPPRPGMRRTLFAIASLSFIAMVLFAWPVRVARSWIASAAPPPTPTIKRGLSFAIRRYTCPFDLSSEDQLIALHRTVMDSRSVKERTGALDLYLRTFPNSAPADLAAIASSKADPAFRVTAIHLLALHHRDDSGPLVVSLLNDPDSNIRAAAADGIDILRGTGIKQPDTNSYMPPSPYQLNSDPPIDIAQFLIAPAYINSAWTYTPQKPVNIDPQARALLEQMMTSAQSAEEREAAARALVHWPPPTYKLRAAEWGVWIADPKGDLKLVQSILDEIPPFVHRIGNPYASLSDRYLMYIGRVTKPILHFTTDRPMALDVEVNINKGRPWFAYPKPDDLVLSQHDYNGIRSPAGTPPINRNDIENLDNPALSSMPDLREGYPWLLPSHRLHPSIDNWGRSTKPWATQLGLRWQNLIVLPNNAPWMTSPTVPPDPKFKWWSDLRAVPSSYLASRGEAERFLYYDGPTLTKPPFVATLARKSLTLKTLREYPTLDRSDLNPPFIARPRLAQDPTAFSQYREAFFIRVAQGKPSAYRFKLNSNVESVQELPANLPIDSTSTLPAFKKLLTDYGLTPEESQGLIDAWETQFFHTEGQRLLLRISAEDYDTLCPLSIDPRPTTTIRLGFVLTEF